LSIEELVSPVNKQQHATLIPLRINFQLHAAGSGTYVGYGIFSITGNRLEDNGNDGILIEYAGFLTALPRFDSGAGRAGL